MVGHSSVRVNNSVEGLMLLIHPRARGTEKEINMQPQPLGLSSCNVVATREPNPVSPIRDARALLSGVSRAAGEATKSRVLLISDDMPAPSVIDASRVLHG